MYTENIHSSVSTLTKLRAGRLGKCSSILCKGRGFYILQTIRTYTGFHFSSCPIVIPGGGRRLSPDIKWPGSEPSHSPSSSASANNAWSYTPSAPYVFILRCLIKHRVNFPGIPVLSGSYSKHQLSSFCHCYLFVPFVITHITLMTTEVGGHVNCV